MLRAYGVRSRLIDRQADRVHESRALAVQPRTLEVLDAFGLADTLRHHDGTVERVTASYVVGCDGAHSTVRTQAAIPFVGGRYPQTFALADLSVDGLPPDTVHAYLGTAGILFFFPLNRPAPWQMITMRPPGWPGATPTGGTRLAAQTGRSAWPPPPRRCPGCCGAASCHGSRHSPCWLRRPGVRHPDDR